MLDYFLMWMYECILSDHLKSYFDPLPFFLLLEYSTPASNDLYLKENDMILLTSQTDNQVGIAQGFIKSINKSKTAFTLLIALFVSRRQDQFSLGHKLELHEFGTSDERRKTLR